MEGSRAELERSDGERTTAFGGVLRGGTRGARDERGRRQGLPVWAKPGAREGGFGRGSARGRPVAAPAANAVTARNREGDGGEGKTVIRSKFKIYFVNSIFLLLHGLK